MNGTTWKVQPSLTPKPGVDSALGSVAATSRTNAWAVGGSHEVVNGHVVDRGLILHWNGSGWKVQASPKLGILNAVSSVNPPR